METAADVRLRIDLIKQEENRHLNCPQIESERTIGSIGCHFGQPLGENVRAAFHDMVMRLHRFYGFTVMDSYKLLGQAGEVRVSQVLSYHGYNAASARLDKKYLVWLKNPSKIIPISDSELNRSAQGFKI